MTHPAKGDALRRWGRVARCDLDPALIEWLAVVAHGLIAAAAEKDTNARRLATVRAVGLSGREFRDADLARVVVRESAPLVPAADRAKLTRVMVGLVTNHVPGTRGEISEEALRKRIARARKTRV